MTSFPPLDFSGSRSTAGLNQKFIGAWSSCFKLTTFPPNLFDSLLDLTDDAFDAAWLNCALNAQSIENILVSLVESQKLNNKLGLDGGTNADKSTWTTAANDAYSTLISRGWDIDLSLIHI